MQGSTRSRSHLNSDGNGKAGVEVENEDAGGWKREFSAVVQDVVKQDAGWKYVFTLFALRSVFVSDFRLLSYV